MQRAKKQNKKNIHKKILTFTSHSKKIIDSTKKITAKKLKAKKSISKVKNATPKNEFSDLEEYLISEVLSEKNTNTENPISLNTILSNLTPSMRKISYKHGYSIGKSIYSMFGDVDALLRFIELGGMRKALYYPYGELSIIHSKPNTNGISCGLNIHFYESGIIAGYLSAYLDKTVDVMESSCVANGSSMCQFNASYGSGAPNFFEEKKCLSPSLISRSISDGNNTSINLPYHMLSITPILESKNIISNLSKILYLSGNELSKSSSSKNLEENLKKMASYLGVSAPKLKTQKQKVIEVQLQYNKYNSIKEYVSITSNLFTGFIKSVTNKNVETSITINKDNVYILKINLLH